MLRSRRKLGYWLASIASWLVGGTLAVRWVTFDPDAQARALWAKVNPMTEADTGGLRALARASSFAEAAAGVESIEVDALAERLRVAHENARALRQRFHPGPWQCARYVTDADTPADPEEAARAIVSAGFASKLEQLTFACAARLAARDDALHAGDEASELLTFFSERADPWTRLGLLLRKEATLGSARALQQPRRASTLPEGLAREANAFCDAYGSPIPGAMLVAKRKRQVDLMAAEAHLLHPDMTQAEVRHLLGDPATEGVEWVYTSPNARVRFDPGGRVAGIVSPVAKWAPTLFVGDRSLVRTDRASLVAALGKPSWQGDGDMLAASDSDEILGYERPPYATVLYLLGGTLRSVELRRAR